MVLERRGRSMQAAGIVQLTIRTKHGGAHDMEFWTKTVAAPTRAAEFALEPRTGAGTA